MATYIFLNLTVLFVVSICLLLLRALIINRVTIILLVILLLTTAAFDTLMIRLSLFAYNPSHILGIFVGLAPIEDFFYAALVVVLVPALWNKLGGSHEKSAATF